MQYLQDMYLQSEPFDPLPIHDINIYSAERYFYFIIERICNYMHIFLTVIFKDNARLAWYDFCYVHVLNISQTFDTGVYFKPYY